MSLIVTVYNEKLKKTSWIDFHRAFGGLGTMQTTVKTDKSTP